VIVKGGEFKKRPLVLGAMMLLAAIAPGFPTKVHAAVQADFYVSPNGNDSNPGTLSLPFATLTKARDVVMANNSSMTGDIIVHIASGNYYVTSTIEFNETDSGTNGHNVIYRATDGVDTAKFIGGSKVTSAWNLVVRTGADADLPAAAEGSVYKTYVGTGVNFNTLYVNDVRAVMARTRNLNRIPGFPSANTDYMVALSGSISSLAYNLTGHPYGGAKAVDGSTSTEWSSNGENNPWIQLDWSSSQTINSVTLDDRVNTNDWIQGGMLTFSDGSSLAVTGIPNNGTDKTVTFANKTVTWVRFQATNSAGNNGLSEFKVWNTSSTNIAPNSTVTVSSEYGVNLDPVAEAGLVNAQARGDLDAQVYVWDWDVRDWFTDTIPIASINASSGAIYLKTVSGHPEAYRPHYEIDNGARYYLQGNLGFLDQPGEYYYNKTTGYLYYYPLAGSGSISSQDIVMPSLDKVIELAGSSRTTPVSNITFDGLQIKDTNFPDYYSYGWNSFDLFGMGFFPPEAQVAGVTQPSYCEQTERPQFHTAALQLTNTSHVTVTNVHVKNVGMQGIELYLANQYANISNSLVEGVGNVGILLEGGYPGLGGDASGNGYNSYNTVTNTIVHDVGMLAGHASAVVVNNSGYNTFSNLEIFNSPRRLMFITGGYSRVPNSHAPNGDEDFNAMTDLYAHDNHFNDIYLHNAQQDGGDDGAFFGCFLYGPLHNYINQMLIDGVGANPTMKDLTPNGVNFDMGDYSLFEVKNFKSVNPQHYNFEGNASFVNANVDFATTYPFDDSLIDYANIGVTASYPSAYLPVRTTFQPPSNIWFQDAFESGLDLSKWMYRGNQPLISTEWMSEGVLNGKRSLKLDSDAAPSGSKPVLYRDFGTSLNKIVSMKLFDRQNPKVDNYGYGKGISSTVRSIARADDGINVLGLGLDTTIGADRYVMQIGSTLTTTSVPRTYGWHELKWDYTSGSDVKMYIDGTLVQTVVTQTSFSRVELGSDVGLGASYYDQVYIYGGTVTPPPPPLTTPPPNLAQNATVTASSQYNSTSYAAVNVIDGIIGQWGTGEWSSNGEANPWIQLNWTSSQIVNKIVLYDRPDSSDWSQGGTLTFSDGSSVTVIGIPNNGTAKVVTFPDKTITWVKFQVTNSTGNNGLSEFQVYDWNLAKRAVITASSVYSSQYAAANVADGIIGQWGTGEWSSNGEANPWIQMDWTSGQTINEIVLYDRPDSSDWSQGGTLSFSDGSSVIVTGIPNNGAAKVVTFPDKNVTWVRFQVTGSSGNNGLSEMQVYEVAAVNLAPNATPSTSSQYSSNYSAAKLIDGVIGQLGTGEWAAAGGDTSPWARLDWSTSQSISKIVLYDRNNSTDQVLSGTLTFSDGSSISVSALNNDGSANTITFATKNVTWVEFQITSYSGLPGLSEFQVYQY
jgi:hypothetical protein